MLTMNTSTEHTIHQVSKDTQRRKLLTMIGGGSAIALAIPAGWVKPVLSSVVLPAHAQTSLCTVDTVVGGPLIGHPSGASTCQAACEFEADAESAQLCNVTESLDSSNAVICSCELDLP